MRFQDRVAIVTGAAGGIGRAVCERLYQEGARVLFADLAARDPEGAAQAISGGGPQVAGQACDVASESDVACACDAAVSRWGRLDVVVNNAGLMTFGRIVDLGEEDWLRVLKVDLIGAAHFIKHAFRRMTPGGAVVNVSSVHAVQTSPEAAPYAAAKAGLLSLTRTAAIEGRELGVRVNAVLPGAVDTPMLWDNPNIRSGAETIAPSDVGRPGDIAAAIAFLASDDARFVTGAALNVDGGRLAKL
jgi:NAD(P)-dependent dehydrogenase (short-subunit alcohol dehydrogenase family)